MFNLRALVVGASLLLSWCIDAQVANDYLVKDLTTAGETASSNAGARIAGAAGRLVFTAVVRGYGRELWTTDGSAAGTVILADIDPGSEGGVEDILCNVGTIVYFSARTPETGYELWKTDGTSEGTVLVKDINPGPDGSSPNEFMDFNGTLYFSAFDPAHGIELWKSDGTADGTVMVADVSPGAAPSFPMNLTPVGSQLFFRALGGTGGLELCVTNGASATVINPDNIPWSPDSIVAFNGQAFFAAGTSSGGRKLWRSDGTTAGTVIAADVDDPGLLTVAGSTLFFGANDAVHGYELWSTQGATASLVKDINPGIENSGLGAFFYGGGMLYFRASDGFSHGVELWKSDGTSAGTVMVKNIGNGSTSSNPDTFFRLANPNLVYFWANDNYQVGRELFVTDGTDPGTGVVRDINPTGDSRPLSGSADPHYVAFLSGSAYFTADDGVHGAELWRSDGTNGSTALVKDCALEAPSSPNFAMTALGNLVMFPFDDGAHGTELWKSDGTDSGTVLYGDLRSGASGSNPSQFGRVGSLLYFRADDGVNGAELWKADGTAGPEMVVDLAPGAASSSPFGFTDFQGIALFWAAGGLFRSDGSAANTSLVRDVGPAFNGSNVARITPGASNALFWSGDLSSGTEPWRTDGTEAGTDLVSDIAPGVGGSVTHELGIVNYDTTRFFSADDGTQGAEVWSTDDFAHGAAILLDINPGAGSSSPNTFRATSNAVFFVADDGVHGFELWKSDSTAAGTTMVSDINPGGASALPYYVSIDGDTLPQVIAVGSNVYFVANDGVHGAELWKSDGTPAGTVMLSDIYPGPTSSNISELTSANGVLFFVANDGAHGRELWKSTGTSAGTHLLIDLNPGSAGSDPNNLTLTSNRLFFMAFEPQHGNELRAISAAFSAPAVVATAKSETAVNVSWPEVNVASAYAVFRQDSIDTLPYYVGGTTDTLFTDVGVTGGHAYLYTVRPADGFALEGPSSAPDLATTVMFADDPLVANTTLIRAQHINQLRTATNAVRALAGLDPEPFTDPTITIGQTNVRAAHVQQLRTALNEARQDLGLPLVPDPTITSTTRIKADYFGALRNGVK